MAEYVQMSLESMIPELETMTKIDLFTRDEVRRITKRRKELEYKLQRGAKLKEDLLSYIRYEWDLLVVIKNKTVDKNAHRDRNSIAHSVTQRLNRLFQEGIKRFGSDVKIWLSYIDFCKQLRLFNNISLTLDKMVDFHQDKPDLFIKAAEIELDEMRCFDRARKFFLNGLRLHKNYEKLYVHAFAMELRNAKVLRKTYVLRDEPVPEDDPVLKGRLAELIYETALLNANTLDLKCDLLSIALEYIFAAELTKRIYTDIEENYRDKERRWDVVARARMRGAPEDCSPKDAILLGIDVYEEAVKTLDTVEMWSLYIETMSDLYEDATFLKNFKRNRLIQAFLGAHCARKLKEEYYLKWTGILDGDDEKEKKMKVLRSSTEVYPGSVELWEQYLVALSALPNDGNQSTCDAVVEAFNAGVSKLKANKVSSLPLWKFIVSFTQLTDPVKAEDIMKKGLLEGGEVNCFAKTIYLEWLVLSKGLKAGRKLYTEWALKPPFSIDFHKKMIELEKYAVTRDLKKLRQCHEAMVDQFGQENAEVWLDFIKFEQTSGSASKVADLYSRAQRSLKAPHSSTFVSLYNFYKLEIETSKGDVNAEEPPAKTAKLS
ncbi:U3 small nucleolar RNA-associated protein 6 [Nesidiocoris tenuis]|uniref:U3 small nucleolar RNA-associated protein 6 n=1 Tax=Nesidiocoris tenuis TaxID=355587 RepID=A0ABN7AQK6_9HEMI|nr:U3 small nucleolar RNA-associated protein 6 [Nesidiocoris tenuis]